MPEQIDPYRLPRTVIPSRYDLRLEPNLHQATFSGSIAITVDVTEPVDTVWLNAAELDVTSVAIEDAAGHRSPLTEVMLVEAQERLQLGLGRLVGAGQYRLFLEFEGILNDKLHGFYRSIFHDEHGQEHVIATTQFETTDARRAFPCFDEPDFKAVFGVTLIVPEALFAVSNAPVVQETATGDGRRQVVFADTMKMSTYLVAFIVGPFEATDAVDVDGIPLRIIHPLGKGHLTAYGLDIGAFALRHLAQYYDIPYPAQKLDLIAIPDFA
ncbi:MAG: M1 family metallopeptidase, partial [Candidatus Tectomicrobia bacterium]